MDPGEREAVLSLVPYFNQEHRVVVDVGSNKGEWADLLVQNVDQIYLFEPNLKLLHYTEIKYCDLRSVYGYDIALGKKDQNKIFYQFDKEYNGLSSLYENEKWIKLPQMRIDCQVVRLDELLPFRHIDLLKIDVEGAEWDVIQGCRRLLQEHKIKFIQIEYSEHYKVPGYTFQSIIDFMLRFDYLLYQFNGRNFFRPNFEEDYRHRNYYFMQEFTEDWNFEFRKNTLGIKCNFALEIGCFEGLTTCYICDLMLNPGGRIICIDPLDETYLTTDLDEDAKRMNKDFKMFKGQYDRFIRNTKGKPVELIRKLSTEVFTEDFNHFRFDFIYIDGDHREKAVYKDAVMSWEVLQIGGYMLFDDYKWDEGTKRGIDRFLRKYGGLLTIKVKDYQVLIMKNVIE